MRSAAGGGSADVGEQSLVWASTLAMLARAVSVLDPLAAGGSSAAEGGSADGDESSPVVANLGAELAHVGKHGVDLRAVDCRGGLG